MRTNRTATLADEVGIINRRNHYENLRKQAMPRLQEMQGNT